MNEPRLSSLPWLPELIEQVRQALAERASAREDDRPALQHQRSELAGQIEGWKQSLGNAKLAEVLRAAIEIDCAAAMEKLEEIDAMLAEKSAQDVNVDELVGPKRILECLDRMANVLAANNPTRSNLELSLHIDRIVCFPDGRLTLRTCKLGIAPDALQWLTDGSMSGEPAKLDASGKSIWRRRNKLCVTAAEDDSPELDALNYLATDPNRFAGLDDRFFWIDTFQIPEKALPWYQEHAELVFRRRQDEKLSYDGLRREFGKSAPTCKAACEYYLQTHPGAVDQVQLSAGGSRRKRVDVTPMADEVRQLWWEDGRSKLELARKFKVAATTIDRALVLAYAKTGEPVPTEKERQQNQMNRARKLLDDHVALEDIADSLHTSNVTVRKLLKQSFAEQGVPMPDLRRRRRQAG